MLVLTVAKRGSLRPQHYCLAEGNQDGLFDELAAKTGASFHQVEARNDVATIIAGLMK